METALPPRRPPPRRLWIPALAAVAISVLAIGGILWYLAYPKPSSPTPTYELQALSVSLSGTGASNSTVESSEGSTESLCGAVCPINATVGSSWRLSFGIGERNPVVKNEQYSVTNVFVLSAGAFEISNVTMDVSTGDEGALPIYFPYCVNNGCGFGGTIWVSGTTVAHGPAVQTLALTVVVEKLY